MTRITFPSDGAEQGEQHERQDDCREGLQRVHHDDQRIVEPAAHVAGEHAEHESRDEREEHGGNGDAELDRGS